MSDPTSTQAAGWYHAQGDPPGTQRYWDGSQWQGGPQPVGGPGAAMGATAFGTGLPGLDRPLAEVGDRVKAFLIDLAVPFVGILAVLVVAAIVGAVVDALGVLLGFVGYLAVLGWSIWNLYVVQGRTGQSLGKKQVGIKLVRDSDGQVVGAGMCFVRYLISGALGFLCGLGTLADHLWPFFDSERKRITDKILKFSVVKA